MPIERHTTENGAHLPIRRTDLTASIIGALFNCHPYVTALRLYAEKRGVEFPDIDNKAMRRGRWLEPSFPRALKDIKPEWEIEPANVYLRDPELRLGATPDFFLHGDPRGLGVLQAKSVAPSVFHREWANGQEVPAWIVFQNTTECLLAEEAYGAWTFGVVAALTVDAYDMQCHLFDVPRDLATREEIIARVKQFWNDVAAGREPEPDFAKDRDAVQALFPREVSGATRDLSGNNEIPVLLAERAELCEEIERKKAKCKMIETELKFLMGDAETMTGVPGWRATYKTINVAGYTVQPRSRRELRIYDRRSES
jgi:predicted phage-related endonuclease